MKTVASVIIIKHILPAVRDFFQPLIEKFASEHSHADACHAVAGTFEALFHSDGRIGVHRVNQDGYVFWNRGHDRLDKPGSRESEVGGSNGLFFQIMIQTQTVNALGETLPENTGC